MRRLLGVNPNGHNNLIWSLCKHIVVAQLPFRLFCCKKFFPRFRPTIGNSFFIISNTMKGQWKTPEYWECVFLLGMCSLLCPPETVQQTFVEFNESQKNIFSLFETPNNSINLLYCIENVWLPTCSFNTCSPAIEIHRPSNANSFPKKSAFYSSSPIQKNSNEYIIELYTALILNYFINICIRLFGLEERCQSNFQ